MSNELEVGVAEMVHDVFFPSGEEIVDDDDAVSAGNQAIHQVGTDEPGPTGHNDPETLPLNPQRDFSDGMHGDDVVAWGVGGPAGGLQVRSGEWVVEARGEEEEEEGGEDNAQEEEVETLFA